MVDMKKSMLEWARKHQAPRIAYRVKGYGKDVEGWLCDIEDNGTWYTILVAQSDGSIVGGPIDIIESVWYRMEWISPLEFVIIESQ